MAEFQNLIQIGPVKEKGSKTVRKRMARGPAKPKPEQRGCEFCTLNKVKGVNKIFGKVRGKRIFIWAQSPGRTENENGKELLGDAGSFLWREMRAVGITRKMCDIQNVVRCFPVDREDGYLKMRNPTKLEIKCCSIYSDEAIEKAKKLKKVRVHLVFGQVAAKALLGAEYRKDRKIFWSQRLGGKVICLDHPAFFIRRGENQHIPSGRLKDFRKQLKLAASIARKGSESRFGYLEKQQYIGVVTRKQAIKAYKHIKRVGYAEVRTATDTEVGWLDKRGRPSKNCTGESVLLVCGFCPEPGTAYVFALGHPAAPITEKARKFNYKIVAKILRDARIKKIFHHGSFDIPELEEVFGRVEGYDWDTNYSEFLANPDRRAYGLEAIADGSYPQFAGYKEIVVPHAFTEEFRSRFTDKQWERMDLGQKYKVARKEGGLNYALIPWKETVLYNGADCDITKRIEISNEKKHVNLKLLHVFRDAAFVLDRMEKKDPPRFDYRHCDLLEKYYPAYRDYLLKKIRILIRKKTEDYLRHKHGISWKHFNPNSPPQVSKLMYKVLHMPQLAKNPSTDKKTMGILAEYHILPKLIQEYRAVMKICSTYLKGYRNCAKLNNGHLRTTWWITGTRTSRLSSGGDKEDKKKDPKRVNLQNIHGDPNIQNLLISDPDWYRLFEYWLKHGPFKSDKDIPDWVWEMDILVGFDEAQMELRVLAQKSGDKELIRIFSMKPKFYEAGRKKITFEGKKQVVVIIKCRRCGQVEKECACGDPHSMVGHALTGWKVSKIKSDERVRRVVKNMQFGMVFGLNEDALFDYMVTKGVYRYAKLDRHGRPIPKDLRREKRDRLEVRKFHRAYFKRFKSVSKMIEKDRAFTEENGYAETLFGFRRPIEVGDDADNRGSYWGNIAVNMPIQGSAHNLILMALAMLWRKRNYYRKLKHIQMEIHDAMYFLTKVRLMFRVAKLGKKLMAKEPVRCARKIFGVDWKVPLIAEPKAGFRFGCILKEFDTRYKNTAEFLNAWCAATKKQQDELQKEMKEKVA